ncbi:hypothetical protein [Streptomyces sp. ISL-94]|uniref:hypothetical protein n=1 Tax=Streptomyces sp. ISL-94 TaxID=2819190 RepID=UPI001BEB42DB|nr:hypothetical protein [Streptomyces sp. ISL-94]MBT2480852.1 hypothetical protein [Streptomyces sp. ISL-94]
MSEPVPVVYDVNVLVGAAAGGNSPFRSWPSPPPTSGNPFGGRHAPAPPPLTIPASRGDM